MGRPLSGAVVGDPGPSSLMGCNESHLDKQGGGKDGGGVDSQEPSLLAGWSQLLSGAASQRRASGGLGV